MTRHTESLVEEKQARRIRAAGESITYQLEGHLQRAGVVLKGLSLRTDETETLMVLRATVDGNEMVAFIGSGDLAGCFIKAAVQAKDSKVSWVPDRFAE